MLLATVGDAESCARHLKRAGLSFSVRLVDTLAAFKEALSEYGQTS
jgi:hypothetical protein